MLRLSMYPAVLFTLVSIACGGGEAPGGGAPPAFPPTDVMTVTLEPKPIPSTSEFVATIRSLRSTTVQPQVEGIVRQVFVQAGDRVNAGQPILQIDPDRQQATVATTEAQRLAREESLAYAKQQLARAQKLFEAGAMSRAELEAAETAHRTAEAQLAAIQTQIRETQVQLQYYRVTAPSAGIIGEIAIRQGDRVTPSTEITTIDEPQGLEAYINVPLERAGSLREGLTVELLGTDGQVMASNPITFIAPRADDSTQSVLAKATLRQMPPSIRVLQYVRARIIWSNEPTLAVPVASVSRLAGQYFVFVAEQGPQGGFVARQKPVMLGEVVGNDYVLRSGLQAGERVITSNIQKIGDGAPVNPS